MIEKGRLVMRKTKNPNHAKLYLFKLNQLQTEIQGMKGQFITGMYITVKKLYTFQLKWVYTFQLKFTQAVHAAKI
jgi:hypothetical protein